MNWYCLQTPEGELLPATISDDAERVRFRAYDVHEAKDGRWGALYWKRYPASWKSLYRLGYRVVPVVIGVKEKE